MSDRTVLATAYGGIALVLLCGCLALIAGFERAVLSGRLTEGVVIAALSTMIAVDSIAVLLLVAWRVTSERADRVTDGPAHSIRPSERLDLMGDVAAKARRD